MMSSNDSIFILTIKKSGLVERYKRALEESWMANLIQFTQQVVVMI